MRRLLAAIVCGGLLAAGCTGGTDKPGAPVQSASPTAPAPTTSSSAQCQELVRQQDGKIADLMAQLEAEKKRTAETSDPGGRPDDVVFRSLALYVYQEFASGSVPADLVGEGTLQFGTGLAGVTTMTPVSSREKVDFAPIRQWFSEHPALQVETVTVIQKSTAGYQRVDLKVQNGFYIVIGFQNLRLVTFFITDKPMDVS